MSLLALAIREHLARYITGEITIQQFREWFSPRAWNIHQHADTPTVQLAHEIDLLLAECDHGDWTEDELKQHFFPLASLDQLGRGNIRVRLHDARWVQSLASGVIGDQPAYSTEFLYVANF